MAETILLITENFPPKIGGSGRYLWEIYRAYRAGRTVIAAGEHPEQEAFDATHDVAVVRMPLAFRSWGLLSAGGLGAYMRAVGTLRKVVRRERVSAIHCGRCLPEGLVGLLLQLGTHLPYCCYVHGEEMNYCSASRELTWLMRRVLSRARFVIANSRNTAEILQREWGQPGERVRIIYPGVDTAEYVPAPRDRRVRERLGWGERPVILTVGRLQKRKGHDRVIEALVEIRKTVPDVLYAIAGDGEERESLERHVEENGLRDHVQFLRQVDDALLRHCYQQCDLFVMANRQVGKDIEGFGIVFLEAQSCGRPVIAGASGGAPEAVGAPESGYVVPCEEPHELAVRAAELLRDAPRRERMGAAGRRWVVEHFDWSVIHRQVASVFGGHVPAP